MKNKALERPQLEKLLEMSKSRQGAPRLVIGVKTPIEIREALLKSDRGEVTRGIGGGIHILMEKPQRTAVTELAVELDLSVAEMVRMLLRAATILGSRGLIMFVDAANRAETASLEAKFKEAGEKKRSATNQGPAREEDGDNEKEGGGFEAPVTGEPSLTIKRQKKGRTGAPKPDESGGVP